MIDEADASCMPSSARGCVHCGNDGERLRAAEKHIAVLQKEVARESRKLARRKHEAQVKQLADDGRARRAEAEARGEQPPCMGKECQWSSVVRKIMAGGHIYYWCQWHADEYFEYRARARGKASND